MIERAHERFGLRPERLVGDGGYGDGPNLAWLVEERGIEPHIPVIDHSARRDGTFERADFTFDKDGDRYICPSGKNLKPRHRNIAAANAEFFNRILAQTATQRESDAYPNLPQPLKAAG